MEDKFTDWILRNLEDRNWSLRVLARKSGVSHATVSRVISGAQKLTPDFCLAIASAFGTDETEVLWRAGFLKRKPITVDDPELADLIDTARQLTPAQRTQAVVLLNMLKAGKLIVQSQGDDKGIFFSPRFVLAFSTGF